MPAFDLRFGRVGALQSSLLPSEPLMIPSPRGIEMTLTDLFFSASGREIDLRVDTSRLQTTQPFAPRITDVRSAELQAALEALAQNRPGRIPAQDLAVIYAPRYNRRANVFGMMFDALTGLDDDPQPHHVNRIPREGCAVFLQSIRDSRRDDDEYRRQVAFTTVHEIAHLFNQLHVEERVARCFLNRSQSHLAPEDSSFCFTTEQRVNLANCTHRDIAPGGNDFGDRELFDTVGSERPAKLVSNELVIIAAVAQQEFWPWEPVELDIEVCPVHRNRNRRWRIWDCVDPGYEWFQIWIEDPTGERRRYRSPRHYCGAPATLSLQGRQVFRRDVSIFAQATGYTFRRAGEYKIWVRFFLSPRRFIESEKITVSIKSRAGLGRATQHKVDTFERLLRRAAKPLYFRHGSVRQPGVAAIKELATRYRREHAGAAALYALGRLYASCRRRRNGASARLLREARQLLQVAEEHSCLSAHRRHKASEVRGELE